MINIAAKAVFDFDKARQRIKAAKSDQELLQAVVDAPFDQKVAATLMFLGITVLLLVNKKTGTIDRVALSDTDLAKNTLEVSLVPFEAIKIPLGEKNNIIAQAIETSQPQDTTDWRFLFCPVLNAAAARINQASAGIAYSAVYPLKVKDGGAMIFSYFQYEEGIEESQKAFMKRYANVVSQSLSGLNLNF